MADIKDLPVELLADFLVVLRVYFLLLERARDFMEVTKVLLECREEERVRGILRLRFRGLWRRSHDQSFWRVSGSRRCPLPW